MNAVVFAQGYLEGGRDGARESLAKFWRSISDEGAFTPAQQKFVHLFFRDWPLQANLAYWWADFLTHYSSPYDFNPLNINPLRDHLVKTIDFEKVRACEDLQLFVSATNVHNGRIAVFERPELTVDHVMASACLPFLFQAVEIAGVPYWDGGYMGNPALFPLFYKTASPDILIVQINPIERNETPKTARDIQDRLNEITFNGALMGEFRAMDFVNRLIDKGKLSERRIYAHAGAPHRRRQGAGALRGVNESAGVLDHDPAAARLWARRREGMACRQLRQDRRREHAQSAHGL